MKESSTQLINKLGLHARAAMQLVNLAGRYQSKLTLEYQGRSIDCKDMLQVMGLGAPCGTTLTIQAEGPDEIQALKDIAQLIQNRFGESE